MSAALIPDAQKGASEEQTSIQKMLIENGRLIEAITEYQRLGRPAEAMKYQELLHRNLLYLGRLVDPRLAQQIQVNQIDILILKIVEITNTLLFRTFVQHLLLNNRQTQRPSQEALTPRLSNNLQFSHKCTHPTARYHLHKLNNFHCRTEWERRHTTRLIL